MKRILCVALVICTLLSISVPCFASEEQAVSPRYTYIKNAYYSLTISSAGVATCEANCQSVNSSQKVRVQCYYQYYNSSKWSSFKYWADTAYYAAEVNEQANTISGITSYRIKAVFTIYDSAGNQLETATYYDYATYNPST